MDFVYNERIKRQIHSGRCYVRHSYNGGTFMFEMKEEYYTGIELIDQQHKKLFEIADEAYNLLKNDYIPDKYDNIMSLLGELKAYTATHFADEEAYMEKIGHKRMFSQKIEHAEFMNKINEFDFTLIEENQESGIVEILAFLNDWLVHHILEKDKLIAEQ